MKTILVVSVKSFYWSSLEECMPGLKKAWALTADRSTRVRFVTIHSPHEALGREDEFRRADLIVLTLFGRFVELSGKGARARRSVGFLDNLVELVRIHLGLATPMVIHSHGEFSAGGVAYSGIEQVLSPAAFVCTSRSDLKALQMTYSKPAAVLAPYALLPGRKAYRVASTISAREVRFVYGGRISEQKNLHQLLLALWILKERSPETRFSLEVFGKADGLGSPNMGIAGGRYETYLRSLCRQLGLQDKVRWTGFVPRANLHRMVRGKGTIVVSASLHSDESFGGVVFHSLVSGKKTVLSAWGSHRDFARDFPKESHLVPVKRSPAGPFISPVDLAAAMASAWIAKGGGGDANVNRYHLRSISHSLKRLARQVDRAQSYRRTSLGRKVLSQYQKLDHGTLHRIQHVFSGYDDPLAQPFFAAWGMPSRNRVPENPRGILIPPWVCVQPSKVQVEDPHRGRFEVRVAPSERKLVRARIAGGPEVLLSTRTARWLLSMGFAYEWNRR